MKARSVAQAATENCALRAAHLLRGARCAQLLVVLFLLSACDDEPTGPTVGSLSVAVSGLPTGLQSAVTVTGPGGYSRSVTATETLASLTPGDYTVTAASVANAEARWSPTPATQTVTVVAGASPATAAVAYAVAAARLTVTVNGLPQGASAAVTVTGPQGFSAAVTATTTLNLLEPGTYTIAAADVASGGTTYRATQASQQVTLTASTTPAAVTVAYGAVVSTGALTVTVTGLPGGVSGAVTVTGPGGYSISFGATTTLQNLAPGSYTVSASTVTSSLTTHSPTPAMQNVPVTAGQTATATVSYGSTPLVLGLDVVRQGLSSPVYLTAPPGDPRLFIVEQGGRIRLLKNGALTTFLDITSRVLTGGEQGLLSMAFDPSYSSNGHFYVYLTNPAGDIQVERYTVSANADVAGTTPTVVITIPHPSHSNHNGGLLLFGPDGMLYMATGDGGASGDPDENGQNLNTLLGKILRIDVRTLPYVIPSTNPFVGQPGRRGEIWAYGLRNPWRYAFDPPSGLLMIADVGQNLWEEVNAARADAGGINYGWDDMEGTHCYEPASGCQTTDRRLPVLEYPHSQGCSVTGGFVYRGSAIPELAGHYLYADYCSGWIRSFLAAESSAPQQRDWGLNAGNVLSFGRDGAGEIYVLSQQGTVYRIARR